MFIEKVELICPNCGTTRYMHRGDNGESLFARCGLCKYPLEMEVGIKKFLGILQKPFKKKPMFVFALKSTDTYVAITRRGKRFYIELRRKDTNNTYAVKKLDKGVLQASMHKEKNLLVCMDETYVTLWKITQNDIIPVRKIKRNENFIVTSIVWINDDMFVSTHDRKKMIIWDGKKDFKPIQKVASNGVYSVVCSDVKGRSLFIGDSCGYLSMYDLQTQKTVFSTQICKGATQIQSLHYCHNNIIVICSDGKIYELEVINDTVSNITIQQDTDPDYGDIITLSGSMSEDCELLAQNFSVNGSIPELAFYMMRIFLDQPNEPIATFESQEPILSFWDGCDLCICTPKKLLVFSFEYKKY